VLSEVIVLGQDRLADDQVFGARSRPLDRAGRRMTVIVVIVLMVMMLVIMMLMIMGVEG
jgi:CHASE3 domain sensor protein